MPQSQCGGYDVGSVAELYDHVKIYETRTDVDFFVEYASQSGGPVLELGCGTGRVLIPTARAGVEIVGGDLSELMLKRCREKVAHEPEAVQDRVALVTADMRDFDLHRQFALVTTPFRPFQHLASTDEQISCLESIHRHLKPGGRLILDIFNPNLKFLYANNVGEEFGLEDEVKIPDGRTLKRAFRITERDLFKQVQQVEIIYYVGHPDGTEERLVQSFPMRFLYRWEAEHLLVRCGFEVESLFADYDRSEFGSKDPGELIFVARKA